MGWREDLDYEALSDTVVLWIKRPPYTQLKWHPWRCSLAGGSLSQGVGGLWGFTTLSQTQWFSCSSCCLLIQIYKSQLSLLNHVCLHACHAPSQNLWTVSHLHLKVFHQSVTMVSLHALKPKTKKDTEAVHAENFKMATEDNSMKGTVQTSKNQFVDTAKTWVDTWHQNSLEREKALCVCASLLRNLIISFFLMLDAMIVVW